MRSLKLFWDSNVGKKVVMGARRRHGALRDAARPWRAHHYQSRRHQQLRLLPEEQAGPRVAGPLFLLATVSLHALTAWQLRNRSRAARPWLRHLPAQVSTLAARTIRWGGVILLAFIVFHILHLTTGTLFPATSGHRRGGQRDPRLPDLVGESLYIVAMLSLGLHLYHGLWSSPRSLGVPYPAAPAAEGGLRARDRGRGGSSPSRSASSPAS